MNMFTPTEEEKRRRDEQRQKAQARSDLAAELGEDLIQALGAGAAAGAGAKDLTPDQIRTLHKQTLALNKTFQRLLSDADGKYDMLFQYSVALRAQNQYRHTVEALNSLKKEEEGE